MDNTIQLSDKLKPKVPFSQVAAYKMLTVGQINPISDPPGQPIIPPTEILGGTTTVYDKYEPVPHLRNKTIQNIVGSKTVYDTNNRPMVQNSVADVEFVSGFVSVNAAKNYNTFVFLERHPGNKDNPFRDPQAPAIFERVKDQKTVNEQLNDETIAFLALNQAHNMSVQAGRAIIAELAPSFPENASSSDVKFKVIQLAKENPRTFVETSPSDQVKIKIQVADAIAADVLRLNEDDRAWYLNNNAKVKKPILTYELGEDPIAKIEQYLESAAGAATLKAIEKELLPEEED